jgi:hypothetical protein
VIVKDLNSTNGTYINGEKITEKALKPGQILRLGQIEVRLEGDGRSRNRSAAEKKKMDPNTRVIPRGVKLNEFDKARRGEIRQELPFAKKSNKTNTIFHRRWCRSRPDYYLVPDPRLPENEGRLRNRPHAVETVLKSTRSGVLKIETTLGLSYSPKLSHWEKSGRHIDSVLHAFLTVRREIEDTIGQSLRSTNPGIAGNCSDVIR